MTIKSTARQQRLASALRENLKRRKALARSRDVAADPVDPPQKDSEPEGQEQPAQSLGEEAARLSP